MKRLVIVLTATTSLCVAGHAATDPSLIPGANDSRIRVVRYSDKIVTRLASTDLVPITVTFGEGEHPVLIAGLKVVVVTPKRGADAKANAAAASACTDWCADRHGNELTLQPIRTDAGSMLVVTTETAVDGITLLRHYAYELKTRNGTIAGAPDAEAYFRVSYTYPDEEAAKKSKETAAAAAITQHAHAEAVAKVGRQKVTQRLAEAPAAASEDNPRNFRWLMNKSPACDALGPDRVSDDGRMTSLHFKQNTPVSQPNLIDQDGKESSASINTETAVDSGLLMTVHAAPRQIILRRGDQVCALANAAYNREAATAYTGTASPDVRREITP